MNLRRSLRAPSLSRSLRLRVVRNVAPPPARSASDTDAAGHRGSGDRPQRLVERCGERPSNVVAARLGREHPDLARPRPSARRSISAEARAGSEATARTSARTRDRAGVAITDTAPCMRRECELRKTRICGPRATAPACAVRAGRSGAMLLPVLFRVRTSRGRSGDAVRREELGRLRARYRAQPGRWMADPAARPWRCASPC